VHQFYDYIIIKNLPKNDKNKKENTF